MRDHQQQLACAERRKVLGAFGSMGALSLLGCNASDSGSDNNTAAATTSSSTGTSSTTASTTSSTSSSSSSTSTASSLNTASNSNLSGCVLIPEETQGPYPLNLSANASYYRQDIDRKSTRLNSSH